MFHPTPPNVIDPPPLARAAEAACIGFGGLLAWLLDDEPLIDRTSPGGEPAVVIGQGDYQVALGG